MWLEERETRSEQWVPSWLPAGKTQGGGGREDGLALSKGVTRSDLIL